MIRKSDWDAVIESMNAEDRQRLGGPPTAEEMLAYERGELPPEEESRVRELLVCHPDHARAFADSVDDEQDSDIAMLSPREIDERWMAMERRIHPPPLPRVLLFWRTAVGIAAMFVLVFGTLYWNGRSELRRPHVVGEHRLLLPDGRRGADDVPATLTPAGDSFLLVGALINQPYFPDYRLEIVDLSTSPSRPVWSSTAVRRDADDTFAIYVPANFLDPGRYQVCLYGVDRGREVRMATYTIRIASP